MAKNYDCSCYVDYPNELHKQKNGTWKCVDKYEKCEDWKPKSVCCCKTHCRRKERRMEIEVKRKVKKEVEEVVRMELKKSWCINIVHGINSLSVVKRVCCNYEPNKQDIADALSDYVGKKDYFASVVERYGLVEVEGETE